MIFNHMVAQWSEKACFFMSKQALTLQFILSKNSIEQPYHVTDLELTPWDSPLWKIEDWRPK